MTPDTRPVRIANCSGFYGDRMTAAQEMVEGGPIDVLTGDYLAELTMLILWKAKRKDPSAGYAKTFLTQMEHVLGTCMDRGIKIVTNAGGLNPGGLAEQLTRLADRLGLAPRIAHIRGDDLVDRLPELIEAGHTFTNLDTGIALADAGVEPVTANAYLGGWGIAAALDAGADIVVCPRVTDAALVVGPAAWWHGWAESDYDRLAGAVVAGHVIECGPQATGGNYSFLDEISDRRRPGFPIADIRRDGSSVISKHPDTGGLVSTGTVTAQLLYEIAGPDYANPDVIARFDTVRLNRLAPDRVEISGVRGYPAPATTKVAINYLGGYRNTMTMVITGLDIEEKARWAERRLFESLGGRESFESVDTQLIRYDRPDAPTNEQATAHLRITVKDPDAVKVGRRFSNATVEQALAGYAGFHTTTPPTAESTYGVYWPALVSNDVIHQEVVLPDGRVLPIAPPAVRSADTGVAIGAEKRSDPGDRASGGGQEQVVRVALGTICGARSGDKGGNANVGLWTSRADRYRWIERFLTIERFRELLGEARDLPVHRYCLPNLNAVNFVVVGLLGDGVAASTRADPQAKGLGEYLRSRLVEVPISLTDDD